MSHTVTTFIANNGYIAIFILMLLESACIPIPSEATMLFGGALANAAFVATFAGHPHHLNFIVVGLVGALANLVGSWLAWYVGHKGGRPAVEHWGRYVRINTHHIDKAESWFAKYGAASVFFGRLLPVVRTFISLPAGVAHMSFTRFTTYTFLGCLPWTFTLAAAGYGLGNNWKSVESAMQPITYGLLALIVGFIAWKVVKQHRKPETVV